MFAAVGCVIAGLSAAGYYILRGPAGSGSPVADTADPAAPVVHPPATSPSPLPLTPPTKLAASRANPLSPAQGVQTRVDEVPDGALVASFKWVNASIDSKVKVGDELRFKASGTTPSSASRLTYSWSANDRPLDYQYSSCRYTVGKNDAGKKLTVKLALSDGRKKSVCQMAIEVEAPPAPAVVVAPPPPKPSPPPPMNTGPAPLRPEGEPAEVRLAVPAGERPVTGAWVAVGREFGVTPAKKDASQETTETKVIVAPCLVGHFTPGRGFNAKEFGTLQNAGTDSVTIRVDDKRLADRLAKAVQVDAQVRGLTIRGPDGKLLATITVTAGAGGEPPSVVFPAATLPPEMIVLMADATFQLVSGDRVVGEFRFHSFRDLAARQAAALADARQKEENFAKVKADFDELKQRYPESERAAKRAAAAKLDEDLRRMPRGTYEERAAYAEAVRTLDARKQVVYGPTYTAEIVLMSLAGPLSVRSAGREATESRVESERINKIGSAAQGEYEAALRQVNEGPIRR